MVLREIHPHERTYRLQSVKKIGTRTDAEFFAQCEHTLAFCGARQVQVDIAVAVIVREVFLEMEKIGIVEHVGVQMQVDALCVRGIGRR